tara:strand:- start:956 stop:1735 length:780 start_codon:yes stop_codon:yes gene_type:complete
MVDNITIDPATAQVTHIRGQKLSEPISLTEWATHTQEYTSLLKEYVLAAYKAQETFKDTLERRPIMQTMDAAIGKDVLDRLQSDMGFTISLIKTTDRWQVPIGEHEVEKPLGTVDLFDLRRVEIVTVCTRYLQRNFRNKGITPNMVGKVDNHSRNAYAVTLKQLTNVVIEELSFPTRFNTRVKVVNEHDIFDEQESNLYAHYLDNIRDILLQEGWRSLGLEEDPLKEKFLPAGAGVLGCWDCPKDGSRDHPFWTNGVTA